MRKTFVFLLLSAALSACTTVPPTNVHQPMTARPQPPPGKPGGDGQYLSGRCFTDSV